MSDTDPSSSIPPAKGNPSELEGLDPGELLARGLQTVKPSVGASAWEPPTPEEVGRLLPQYRIESLLGRGGMGAVYKGVQLTLGRLVAIKLLPVEVAADAQFVTRFEREARTLAKLQHSRIVTIYDFGQTSEGHFYFVMEYVDGTDLRRILKGPGLDPEQALAVVGQLCDALQAAHREGIVHRDIKPENVLITRDGYVKLADFGLSRPPQEAGTSALTNTNVVMGTPDYMAPEQREGVAKADHRSDIFALGVMFYEMLTGRTPRGVFDPPSHKVQVDVRIDEVVLKALQFEPDRRYQQASELKNDVERIRTTPLPVPPLPAPAAPIPARRSTFTRVALGCAALFLAGLVIAMAGAFLWWGKSPAPKLSRETGPAQALHADLKRVAVDETSDRAAEAPGAVMVARNDVPPQAGTEESPTAEEIEHLLVSSVWQYRTWDWRFYPDGTATLHGFTGGFHWSVDRSVNPPVVHVSELGEEPNQALRGDLLFYKNKPGLTLHSHRFGLDEWEWVPRLGSRAPAPGETVDPEWQKTTATFDAVEKSLVTNPWQLDGQELRFQPDGLATIAGTRTTFRWSVDRTSLTLPTVRLSEQGVPPKNARQFVFWFDKEWTAFTSYECKFNTFLSGGRVLPGSSPAATPAPAPVAVAAKPSTPSPAALRARHVYEAIVGYNWAWANVGDNNPPLTVQFVWDGHVSGGWTWSLNYKLNGETVVDCSWGDDKHQYLVLNAAVTEFDAFDMTGKQVVKGTRLGPAGKASGAPGTLAAAASMRLEGPGAAADPNQPLIETLSQEGPNASAWVLAPLNRGVPPDIRQNVTYLREDLMDEAVKKPKASPEAYRLGEQLCNMMIATLDERDRALANAGFRAFEAQTRTGVTSQALEARRNYKMSWPQYAREESQRAELKSQAMNSAAVMAERPKMDWLQRTDQIRPMLDALYSRFRAALRQPPAAK